MEPYQYIITYNPENADPTIWYQGLLMADSQKGAFKKMIDIVTAEQALEADRIEFWAKCFIDEKSCPTKKDMGDSISYKYYMNENIYELRNSTVSLEDFLKGSFMNYINPQLPKDLPMVMMMIDVLGLLNDDKL